MILKIVLVLLFLSLGQFKEQNTSFQILNLITFLLIGAFSLSKISPKKLEKLSLAVVSLICLSYLVSIFFIYPQLKKVDLTNPASETYVSDEKDFLKTFYLMKNEKNYYSAFKSALEEDARFQTAPKSSFAWRTPTIFYIWSLIAQNGNQIRILFIALSSASIFCAYFISKKLVGVQMAVFSSYLIVPYFLDALTSGSFIFMEWWGLFFFIFALTAFFYNKKTAAYILLLLSVSIRELFLLPALSIVFIDFYKSKKISLPLAFTVLTIILWVLHLHQISSLVGNVQLSPRSRIHGFDKNFLMSSLAFSTRLYKLATLRIGTLFLLFSFLGLAKLYLFAKSTQRTLILIALASFILTIAIAPFIGTRAFDQGTFYYADYWGIIFVPIAIIFSPMLLPKGGKS